MMYMYLYIYIDSWNIQVPFPVNYHYFANSKTHILGCTPWTKPYLSCFLGETHSSNIAVLDYQGLFLDTAKISHSCFVYVPIRQTKAWCTHLATSTMWGPQDS